MLASLRKNTVINALGRIPLRWLDKHTSKRLDFLIKLWPLSGVISLNFSGLKFKMYCECDDHIVNTLYYDRPYLEAADTKLFMTLVKKGGAIFYIGGNTGIDIIIGGKCLPELRDSKIFCFEPDEANSRRLKMNLTLNQIANVNIMNYALVSGIDLLNFKAPKDDRIIDVGAAVGNFSSRMYQNKIKWQEVIIKQTTIDIFINDNAIKQVALLKIDVENYETLVLKGATNTIMNFKPIISCVIFFNTDKKQFFDAFLMQYQYYPYLLQNDKLKLLLNGLEPDTEDLNYVFAPFKISNEVISIEEFCEISRKGRPNKVE